MFDEPIQVLRSWMDAVNSGDLEKALSLYADDGTLLPTFSNKSLSDPEGIKDYFSKLAGHKDLSVALHDKTLRVQSISPQVHVLTGIYCWRFEIDDELLNFEARFTFAINLDKPGPIVHQHSSQLPRML